ncbi:MAG: hypothetical protein D6765_04660 [Bacteroidetes bacterium]|nr:MAG: hypothetical protein D6765_04660 [Bacteroidota bacterium]
MLNVPLYTYLFFTRYNVISKKIKFQEQIGALVKDWNWAARFGEVCNRLFFRKMRGKCFKKAQKL